MIERKLFASTLGFYFGDVTHVLEPETIKRCKNNIADGKSLPMAIYFSEALPDTYVDTKGNEYDISGRNIGLVPLEYTKDGSEYDKGIVVNCKSTALFIVDGNTITFELSPSDKYIIEF